MFLLNCYTENVGKPFKKFTIQNVSIKYKQENKIYIIVDDLQYKMFLLNQRCFVDNSTFSHIYNTKCFY